MKYLSTLILGVLIAMACQTNAEPLKIYYDDWPSYTILEVAKQKGWFKEAGVEVELVWFERDYQGGLDALAAHKLDAMPMTSSDVLGLGAKGYKGKIVALLDYSNGGDKVIGKAGIESIKDLKGKKIGVEIGLCEHLLLLKALKANNMRQSDVELVNTTEGDITKSLASGKVDAIATWYPVTLDVLTTVPGSKPLYTSAEEKGLFYDVFTVNEESLAKRKADWTAVVKVYYRAIAFLQDPATHDEAVKIMAERAGKPVAKYTEGVAGLQFLAPDAARTAFKKGYGFDSIYGSLDVVNKFNVDNKIYDKLQTPADYIESGIVADLK